MAKHDSDAGIGRLQALFAEATTLPPIEREAFARRQAGDDAALLRELLALIAADAGLDGMTAQPAGAAFDDVLADALASVTQGPSLTGTRVGRFELREELGHGGMGRVYRAVRVDGTVQQEAAIKFVRRDRLDAGTLRRFRLERQLAAGLDHPGIARLLDADQLDDGTPFYVMEYVRGVPIVEYCDRERLDVRARVELVRKVCAAVTHAHGRLVVHRDLKPANILVADDGNPKLLDFGIAKLLDPSRPGDDAELTGTGQRLFSPQYAAPEQVVGAPVGVATDVHAIGLLLYELLAGVRAWELGTLSAGQVERIVTEVVPRVPSAAAADAKDDATRARARPLRGDLDGIVMRCLRKSPAERYASVERLDEDLANYLEGRPVVARGGHAWYRVRKWTRRNAGAVAAGIAIVASLVAGIVAFASQARIAEQRAAELEQVAEFQAEMLAQVDPGEAGSRLDEAVRRQHAAALDAERLAGEEREASAQAFDREWRRINTTDAATGLLDESILKPAQAAIAQRFAGQPIVAARLEYALGERYAQLGLYEKALEIQRHALHTRTEVLGRENLDTLDSMNKVAQVLDRMSRYDEVYPLLTRTLELRRRLQGPEHQSTLETQDHLGSMLAQMGRVDEGLKLLKETIAIERRVLGNEHEDTLGSLSNLATFYMMLGVDPGEGAVAAAEAAAGLTKLRGPDDPMTLSAINAQGMLLWRANRLAEAEPIVRESLARRRRALGEDHPMTLTGMNNLALVLQAEGEYPEAEALMRDVLEKRKRALGDDHELIANSLSALGGVLLSEERLREAEDAYRQAYVRQREKFGESHPETVRSKRALGIAIQRQGRIAEAEPLVRSAYDARTELFGPDHAETLSVRSELGSVLVDAGRYGDAQELLVPIEAKVREAFAGPKACVLSQYLLSLGSAQLGAGDVEAAATTLREAEEVADGACPAASAHHARVAKALAKLAPVGDA